jgi:hypothetical protein
MGASGWSYYVPYVADLNEALKRLREQVFRDGRYYRRDPSRQPKSIAQLVKMNEEDGTHSILDMTGVEAPPTAPGPRSRTKPPNSDERGVIDMTRFDPDAHQRWLKEAFGAIGKVRELHPDDLRRFFGTTRPSRADVEAHADDVMEFRERGEGTVVVIYEGDVPKELFFAGYSGD